MNERQHEFNYFQDQLKENSRRVEIVLTINILVMILEIYFGWISGSMALLADGWHMATHAFALGLSVLIYRLIRSPKIMAQLNFGGGKLLSLGGYTSALFLIGIAFWVALESVVRFLKPQNIQFLEAIVVALIGLIINMVGAFLLRPQKSHTRCSHSHHNHYHGSTSNHADGNMKAAYIHILADALTSIAALFALAIGYFTNWTWLDALIGLISSVVILKWAYALLKETLRELVDAYPENLDIKKIYAHLEAHSLKVQSLRVWKIGPEFLTAQIVVSQLDPSKADQIRFILEKEFGIQHSIIEIKTN